MHEQRDELLPGVKEEAAPPRAVFDPAPTVRTARRRAAAQDFVDLLLLIGVDWLFQAWPRAHVPFLSRHQSTSLLIAVNVLFVLYLFIARKLPAWRARRIARTWRPDERSRLSRTRRV